jgi:hypothetical protein
MQMMVCVYLHHIAPNITHPGSSSPLSSSHFLFIVLVQEDRKICAKAQRAFCTLSTANTQSSITHKLSTFQGQINFSEKPFKVYGFWTVWKQSTALEVVASQQSSTLFFS